jgi:hypothetical protein
MPLAPNPMGSQLAIIPNYSLQLTNTSQAYIAQQLFPVSAPKVFKKFNFIHSMLDWDKELQKFQQEGIGGGWSANKAHPEFDSALANMRKNVHTNAIRTTENQFAIIGSGVQKEAHQWKGKPLKTFLYYDGSEEMLLEPPENPQSQEELTEYAKNALLYVNPDHLLKSFMHKDMIEKIASLPLSSQLSRYYLDKYVLEIPEEKMQYSISWGPTSIKDPDHITLSIWERDEKHKVIARTIHAFDRTKSWFSFLGMKSEIQHRVFEAKNHREFVSEKYNIEASNNGQTTTFKPVRP